MRFNPKGKHNDQGIVLVAYPEDYDNEPNSPKSTIEARHSSKSPGGRLAKMQGCICPEIHDSRGDTILYVDGHRMKVYRAGCPVHTPVKFRGDKLQKEAEKIKKSGELGLYEWDFDTDDLRKTKMPKPKKEKEDAIP